MTDVRTGIAVTDKTVPTDGGRTGDFYRATTTAEALKLLETYRHIRLCNMFCEQNIALGGRGNAETS